MQTVENLEKKALEAIQRIFPCEKELLNKIPMDKIVEHFQDQLLPQKHPFLIRIAGQSGSGKSSQIVPALESVLNNNYLKINVGSFAIFHPQYEKWTASNPTMVRENTNGFALRALFLFYQYCIKHKVNLIFDMTLLEPEIDLYLMGLAKQHNYRIQMHLLCVPKKISNLFIRLRQKQTGRCVKISSSSYFFNALAPCLKALTHCLFFDTNDTVILWGHAQSNPLKITHFKNSSILKTLEKFRCHKNMCIKNPKSLFKTKKKWMRLLLKGY